MERSDFLSNLSIINTSISEVRTIMLDNHMSSMVYRSGFSIIRVLLRDVLAEQLLMANDMIML